MIGKTILHYKIIEKLGEGGMGVVYKAEDTKLKRDVAIKFLPHHIAASEEERKRFKIEAQAAAALTRTSPPSMRLKKSMTKCSSSWNTLKDRNCGKL